MSLGSSRLAKVRSWRTRVFARLPPAGKVAGSILRAISARRHLRREPGGRAFRRIFIVLIILVAHRTGARWYTAARRARRKISRLSGFSDAGDPRSTASARRSKFTPSPATPRAAIDKSPRFAARALHSFLVFHHPPEPDAHQKSSPFAAALRPEKSDAQVHANAETGPPCFVRYPKRSIHQIDPRMRKRERTPWSSVRPRAP